MSRRGDTISMLLYFTLGGMLTNHEISAQAPKCGGVLEADKGDLEVQPSNTSCVWIIQLQNMTGINLKLKHLLMEPIIVIPEQNTPNPDLESFWMIGPRNIYIFPGEMLAIVSPPRNKKALLSWTGSTVFTDPDTLSAKFERNSQGWIQLEWSSEKTKKVFWVIEPEAGAEISWEFNEPQDYFGTVDIVYSKNYLDNRCDYFSFWVIQVMPDGTTNNTERDCVGGHKRTSLEVTKNSKILVILHSSFEAGSNLLVSWKEALKKNVRGLLVGTEAGLHVVTLEPRKQIQVSSKCVDGVAFDWHSQKIYWVERAVGIMRASLDGGDSELLIADEWAVGLGIESITGNLYYGSKTRNSLRVCNNHGLKCSSIISLTGSIWDIALHPSRGLLFWSITDTKILRSNLDGSDITEIAQGRFHGISVDEVLDRVFATNYFEKEILDYDLIGHNLWRRSVSSGALDVEMDGYKVLYVDWDSKSLRLRSNGHATMDSSTTSIADFNDNTRYMASFGEKIAFPRTNPCENAKCSHLCVIITPNSNRCLCPEGKKLQKDGISCRTESLF